MILFTDENIENTQNHRLYAHPSAKKRDVVSRDKKLAQTITGSAVALHCRMAHSEINRKMDKNSSGDEIANVNFYAVRPEGTRIR